MSKFGVPTEEQLAKINKISPKTFSTEEVFVFSGKSAGDMVIDNRYIQLSKEILETFVKDAKTGVSWLLNHSWSSWSEPVTIFGRTFDGRLESSSVNGETVAMHLDKYIPRSDTLKNGRSANSVIEDIENGVLFDTSIGWGSSKMVCSICNMDYYGGECNHLRGRMYEGADGNRKLCYIIAKNPGYLMEESGVFDGAYRGAGISMSTNAGDEFETPQGKFIIVDELKELPKGTNVLGCYSEKAGIVTFIKKSEHKKTFALGSALGKEYSDDDVLRFAKEGIEYHKQTVEEAIRMGVRAMGNDFPAETWKSSFATMGTKAILDIAKTWEIAAKNSIPAGRWTDPGAGMGESRRESVVPDSFFKI